ncbi:hypothetical protein DMENIID0001_019460 [Sergentomyia squamirostris]
MEKTTTILLYLLSLCSIVLAGDLTVTKCSKLPAVATPDYIRVTGCSKKSCNFEAGQDITIESSFKPIFDCKNVSVIINVAVDKIGGGLFPIGGLMGSAIPPREVTLYACDYCEGGCPIKKGVPVVLKVEFPMTDTATLKKISQLNVSVKIEICIIDTEIGIKNAHSCGQVTIKL